MLIAPVLSNQQNNQINDVGKTFFQMRPTLFVPEPVKADVGREREHVVVELEGLDEVEVVQKIIRKLLQTVGAQVKDLQGPLQTLEGTRGDRT